MKPRILLSAPAQSASNYVEAVLQAGGDPTAQWLPAPDDSYDALILCGGGDIAPELYGQPLCGSNQIVPERDRAEFALAERYLAMGKPILGICRGHQVLNVVLGGTLLQDIGDPLHLFHTRGDLPEDRIHPIWCSENSFLHAFYGPLFPVNSSHHQAVDRLGDGLQAAAWSESGLVEALEHTTLPVRCTQWHPERMTGRHRRSDTVDGARLFEWLIAACR